MLVGNSAIELQFDISAGFLDLDMQKIVFRKLHELSHPGVKAAKKLGF